MNKRYKICTLIIILLLTTANLFAANSGRISGKIVDAQTGEAIVGANVYLDSTTIGAASDLDGNYLIIGVPDGAYTLIISVVGYREHIIHHVNVKTDEVTKLHVTLKPEILTTEAVVIEARALKNTDASVLRQRQKSNSISDAISAEMIMQTGSNDAASAMSRVTGASVIGGKYIFIRGLGERYSNTQLNGMELPSADPDKKSFNMDIVPSNLLDNIVIKKTFTPDEPGNFSGGIVNIGTKSFPEVLTLKLSNTVTYNSQANLNPNYLSYDGGSKEWLGIDDGSRALPGELKNPAVYIPTVNEARNNKEKALTLDRLSKAFNEEMSPARERSPLNQSYSIGVGNNSRLFNKDFGYFASFSYSDKYAFYEKGIIGRWILSGPVDQSENLNPDMVLSDTKSSREVLWGGLATLSFKPQLNHEIDFNFLYTNSGESVTRYQKGEWPNQLDPGSIYETRSLLFTQRNLASYQLKGQHRFTHLFDTELEWNATVSNSEQDEPDLRFFSDDYSVLYENGSPIDTIYGINLNLYNVPTRFFRNLQEDKSSLNFNLSSPLKVWNGLNGKVKFGAAFNATDRTFRERRFEFRQQRVEYDGNPESFFAATGIVDSSNARRIYFGNYVVDASSPRSNYDGAETISAAYAMTELPLTTDVRVIGGVRFETTRMNVSSKDTSEAVGKLDNNDLLPSLGFIYQIKENMNLRLSYGRTLARPNIREKAAFRSFEFLGDYLYVGNANLKRTLIDNYDLRWEWFSRPSEIYAVSAFYKSFKNPIERVFDNTRESYTYLNLPEGLLYGAEFEVRKNLDAFSSYLHNFSISANLTLIHSEVDITIEELEMSLEQNPGMSRKSPLFGQSPYIINLDLAYSNEKSGTNANILFNQFGKRLVEVKYGATPDVYEQPRPMLDFIVSQRLYKGIQLKAAVKNALNTKNRNVMTFRGKEYIHHSYSTGISYSMGLSYSL